MHCFVADLFLQDQESDVGGSQQHDLGSQDEDEDEFSYHYSPANLSVPYKQQHPKQAQQKPKDRKVELMSNQHHDEAFEVESEDIDNSESAFLMPSPAHSAIGQASKMASPPTSAVQPNQRASQPIHLSSNLSPSHADTEASEDAPETLGFTAQPRVKISMPSGPSGASSPASSTSTPTNQQLKTGAAGHAMAGVGMSVGGSELDEEDDEDEDLDPPTIDNGASLLYNPDDYRDLNVSQEIRDIFDHINRYKPVAVELETRLVPFIPDFVPAVGEIDAFVKVPPPDGREDGLGLRVLDEPSAHQSDPTVLDLRLRVLSKHTNLQPANVRSIEHADKFPGKITNWINNIHDVHRQKPPPTVNYSKPMPSIEQLMRVWPEEFEAALKKTPLPSAEMDMTLAQYAKVACALLDIPIHSNLVESLHVLFTLYSEFRSNQHFQS